MSLLDKSGDGSLQVDEQIVLVDDEFMVDIDPKGILKCVDGRGSDNKAFGGPKMPGGIYAIAHNRHTTTIEGLKAITKEVIAKGHVPSVHGDHSSDWDVVSSNFGFNDMSYPRPEFDADQGAAAVKEAGGVIEIHHGSHAEKVVLINLVENKTLEPIEDDQRFIVDGWENPSEFIDKVITPRY